MSTATLLLDIDVQPGKPPMLQVEPTGDAARWALEHRDVLRLAVTEHGALLVRGLALRDAAEASEVFRQLGSLMTEREGFVPREKYTGGVYSASKWPASRQMRMHHELSYVLEVPHLMLFACLEAPIEQGATPVADAPAVLSALPAEIVERFEHKGWLLVRNYNDDVGASISDVFGTEDPKSVERYCRVNDISYEWQSDGTLRTWQRRNAVVRHPITGQRCWFNQIAFLNQWAIKPEVRDYLVELYGEEGLPFNTRVGNGEPIGEDIVRTINDVYEAHTVREPWRDGDLLIVDNVRTAHGREPYRGPREVVVGMVDAVRVSDDPPSLEAIR